MRRDPLSAHPEVLSLSKGEGRAHAPAPHAPEACRYAPAEPWATAEETKAMVAECRATDALANRAQLAILAFAALWFGAHLLAALLR